MRVTRSSSRVWTGALFAVFLWIGVLAGCTEVTRISLTEGDVVRRTFTVLVTVGAEEGEPGARGVLAVRYPDLWDVESVTYSGDHTGTAQPSNVMGTYFRTTWERTPPEASPPRVHNGRRYSEALQWNYTWWAGYGAIHDWEAGDTVTVAVTFSTDYQTSLWPPGPLMLDIVTGVTDGADPELTSAVGLRSIWEAGGSGDGAGVALDIPIELRAFTDVLPTHEFSNAIEWLSHLGFVDGYYHEDTTREFRPEGEVWRAQFAKMVTNMNYWDPNGPVTEDLTSPFTDLGPDVVPPSEGDHLYPHEYVAWAYAAGITNGTSATTFSPYASITRAQVVTMAVRALETYAPVGPPPADYRNTWGTSFSPVHGPNARLAEHLGLLNGLDLDGAAANPWAPMPRGEVAQVMWNGVASTYPPHSLF